VDEEVSDLEPAAVTRMLAQLRAAVGSLDAWAVRPLAHADFSASPPEAGWGGPRPITGWEWTGPSPAHCIRYWQQESNDLACAALDVGPRFYIGGCAGGHPEIACNEWSFGNSDGSTGALQLEVPAGTQPTLESLLHWVEKVTPKYLFDQEH